MRLALGVTTSMPVKECIALGRTAEKNGYHRIWVGEDLHIGEVFSYLSVLASKTAGIGLGTGSTSPWVRNLGVIANSSAGIQALSKGRFTLGLGVGGTPELTKFTGSTPRNTYARMREATLLLRRILNGKEVTYRGRFSTLRGYGLAYNAAPPNIYLRVRGARMLKLAGEIADGVIFSGALKAVARDVKIVEKAAEKSSRNPREMDRVLWNPFVLVERKEDLSLAREVASVMQGSMPDNASLEELCIYGTEEEIMEKLPEYEALGINELVVGPPYGRKPGNVIASLGGT